MSGDIVHRPLRRAGVVAVNGAAALVLAIVVTAYHDGVSRAWQSGGAAATDVAAITTRWLGSSTVGGIELIGYAGILLAVFAPAAVLFRERIAEGPVSDAGPSPGRTEAITDGGDITSLADDEMVDATGSDAVDAFRAGRLGADLVTLDGTGGASSAPVSEFIDVDVTERGDEASDGTVVDTGSESTFHWLEDSEFSDSISAD